DAQQQAVSVTDTFIIGTADGDGNADASHRGGNPGFLRLLSPKLLRWPDYLGNSMFMTLGNLHVDPRCGLLIPDWRTGSTLQLTGTARLNWDESTFAPGAQCSVDFTIDEVVETVNGSPLRWGHAEPSPANPPL
ncbi:pyridoxamine 5'-phosphate oxidase family protein, partial [Mycobacteroides abscessus subsp. abscessus]